MTSCSDSPTSMVSFEMGLDAGGVDDRPEDLAIKMYQLCYSDELTHCTSRTHY